MTIETSRRALLTGAAALSAIAMPIAANAIDMKQCSFPELAKEMEAVYHAYFDRTILDANRQTEFEEKVSAATGRTDFPPKDAPGYKEYLRVRGQLSDQYSKTHPDPHGKGWDVIHTAMYDVTERVLRQPAQTMGDVLVQARAYAFSNNSAWLWQDYENYDVAHAEARIVVDNLCRINQLDLFPGLKIESVKYYGVQYADEETASAQPPNSEWQSDPIWKLIDKHRSAIEKMNKLAREHTAADEALGADMSSRKRLAAAEVKYDRAVDREGELGKAVITARPTTDAGLAAMIVYIRDTMINGPSEFDYYIQDGELEVFFKTLIERIAVPYQELLKQKGVAV